MFPSVAKAIKNPAIADDGPGSLYNNYTYFEACQAFLDGDQDIEMERSDIDYSKCLDRWPELGE